MDLPRARFCFSEIIKECNLMRLTPIVTAIVCLKLKLIGSGSCVAHIKNRYSRVTGEYWKEETDWLK
ncbi:unnamed protein product [Allacma fusca]|uniref:Uncharacterized protein n=1 Tax=Allacma fusca TaxID=39272 RepID=A0A8J2KJG7_9HEXA|nr:unnamed protein product [Allacma fusca]